jgi:deoxycytidylate deaminase
MPSVLKRRHAVGKIWKAGAAVRFTRSARLAATLPRSISDANSDVNANSLKTRHLEGAILYTTAEPCPMCTASTPQIFVPY